MKADRSHLSSHIDFLTELRPFRNYQNLESLEKVCVYLSECFQSYGFSVERQVFSVNRQKYSNILASYQAELPKRLIVGAHYDVCGDQPGADDNASAVTGLLECARLISEQQPDLAYGVDFVSYCLEEPPFFGTEDMGSYHHASSISAKREQILGVINFEMIGYYHDGPQPYPDETFKRVYPEQANFVAVVGIERFHEFNQIVYERMKGIANIDVQMIDDPRVENLASLSDQLSYWEFGIPALMINDTSFLRNPNYHQPTDTADTLNLDAMAEVIQSVYHAITHMPMT